MKAVTTKKLFAIPFGKEGLEEGYNVTFDLSSFFENTTDLEVDFGQFEPIFIPRVFLKITGAETVEEMVYLKKLADCIASSDAICFISDGDVGASTFLLQEEDLQVASNKAILSKRTMLASLARDIVKEENMTVFDIENCDGIYKLTKNGQKLFRSNSLESCLKYFFKE